MMPKTRALPASATEAENMEFEQQQERERKAKKVRRSTFFQPEEGSEAGALEEEPPYSWESFQDDIAEKNGDRAKHLFETLLKYVVENDEAVAMVYNQDIQLRDAKIRMQELEEEIRVLETAKETLVEEAGELKVTFAAQSGDLMDKLKKAKDRGDRYKKEMTSLESRISVLDTLLVEMKSVGEVAQDEATALRKDLKDMNKKTDNLIKEANDLEHKVKHTERLLELARKRTTHLPTPSVEDRGRPRQDSFMESTSRSRSRSHQRSNRSQTVESVALERLTTMLEKQQNGGYGHTKEAHIQDPEKLVDGTKPLYQVWKKGVEAVFGIKIHSLASSSAKMAYVYANTTGAAQERLAARFNTGSEDDYTDVKQMFEDLKNAYVDPNYESNCKNQYRKLKQREDELFIHFEQRFYKLAVDGGIGRSEWRDDLLEKTKQSLRAAVYSSMDLHPGYQGLVDHLNLIDRRVRLDSDQSRQKGAFKNMNARAMLPTTITPGGFGNFRAPQPFSPKFGTVQDPQPKMSFSNHTTFSKPAMKQILPATADADKIAGNCFNCHKSGHQARNCPDLATAIAQMSGPQLMEYLQEAEIAEMSGQKDSEFEEVSDEDDDQGNAHS